MRTRALVQQLAHGARVLLSRRCVPCFLGVVLTDRCNLDCFYCAGRNRGQYHFTFEHLREVLEQAYRRGHRIVYFTGGEPSIWRDSDRTLADVVVLAREIGFLDVYVYTNGTRPLDIGGCTYLVTIDGPQRIHDEIRSGSFELITNNVAQARARAVFASITLTRRNAPHLVEFVREVSALKLFRGICFNLLTGRPEVQAQHGVTGAARRALLDQLWQIKRAGYPIVLSRAAYHAMRNNDWQRPIPQIELATDQQVFPCCRDVLDPSVCETCGYTGCVEIAQLLALRPSALWAAWTMARASAVPALLGKGGKIGRNKATQVL